MPHCGLCRAWSNSTLGEQRRECASQSVNVQRPPPFVTLWDAGGVQVTVEDSDQPGGNAKQSSAADSVRVVVAQPKRGDVGRIGQPFSQVVRQVEP